MRAGKKKTKLFLHVTHVNHLHSIFFARRCIWPGHVTRTTNLCLDYAPWVNNSRYIRWMEDMIINHQGQSERQEEKDTVTDMLHTAYSYSYSYFPIWELCRCKMHKQTVTNSKRPTINRTTMTMTVPHNLTTRMECRGMLEYVGMSWLTLPNSRTGSVCLYIEKIKTDLMLTFHQSTASVLARGRNVKALMW